MIDKSNMIYRSKVSGIILNDASEVLLVQLNEYKDNEWNVPGGGVEPGESHEDALKRELSEELGTDKFKILRRSSIINRYDFPDQIIEKIISEGKNYRGQEQVQFVAKFLGDNSDLNLQIEEIKKYQWVGIEELGDYLVFPNQLENIKSVIEEYKESL